MTCLDNWHAFGIRGNDDSLIPVGAAYFSCGNMWPENPYRVGMLTSCCFYTARSAGLVPIFNPTHARFVRQYYFTNIGDVQRDPDC